MLILLVNTENLLYYLSKESVIYKLCLTLLLDYKGVILVSTLWLILSLVIVVIGAYFFYGIFVMQLGNMVRIKRGKGLTYRSQISVSWSEFTKKSNINPNLLFIQNKCNGIDIYGAINTFSDPKEID